MRAADRDRAVTETVARVMNVHLARARAQPGWLELLVRETLYAERQRLEAAPGTDALHESDRAFLRAAQRRLRMASERELSALLTDLTRRFADEVVGHFDPRVYRVATGAVPSALSLLLGGTTAEQWREPGELLGRVAERIEIQGATDHVRALFDRGTVMVTPTHSSHLDSIVLGYAVHLLGLPPLLYGAGLNLFNSPVVSFFMNHLGAYRVDRKKKAELYKEVLKTYATVSLEYGYHNLFFPGGTRSRSGAVEQRLKRGLLGTGLTAFIDNLENGKARPQVYIAPCTIAYKLVLEAETLVDDWLQEAGRARYVIDQDEFSRPRRLLSFLGSAGSLQSRVVVTFGTPLDVVGNPVDADGQSLDPRGRPVDVRSYVRRGGLPVHDAQRDEQYTNELAAAVVQRFREDSVILSTQLVAAALWCLLRRDHPGADLFHLLRGGGEPESVARERVATECEQLVSELRALPTRPRLGQELQQRDMDSVVADALRHFATYHTHPVASAAGDRVLYGDRRLALFYAQRLAGYGLPGLEGVRR